MLRCTLDFYSIVKSLYNYIVKPAIVKTGVIILSQTGSYQVHLIYGGLTIQQVTLYFHKIMTSS